MDLDETWYTLFYIRAEELERGHTWVLVPDNQGEQGSGWKKYTVETRGSFRCTKCRRWWTSAQVHIVFHLRLNRLESEGLVKMRLFRQECKRCSAGCFEDPTFTPEIIDNVLGKLMGRLRKTCYGEQVADDQASSSISYGRREGPHEKQHCEACRLGLCDWRASNHDPPDAPPLRQSVASSPTGEPIEEMQNRTHSRFNEYEAINATNALWPTPQDNASNVANPVSSSVIPPNNASYGADPAPTWDNTTYRADPVRVWTYHQRMLHMGQVVEQSGTVWQIPPDYPINVVQPRPFQELSPDNASFGVASRPVQELSQFNATYEVQPRTTWEMLPDNASDRLEHANPVLVLQVDNASDGVDHGPVLETPPEAIGAILRKVTLVCGLGTMLWWMLRRFRARD
ncbi:hypothetical protein NDU88_000362 [Pleurodeles waltl]|uniref:3CxxC-type domain-containing protein n=1 Tax=Pleurodeles waltl TaxID=8319 RepID=A0AAV7L7Y1_PLEWA|nr:hypothetical protein NDU88_000362 [Pleurodeles waltl]